MVRAGLHAPYRVTKTNISLCEWNGVQQTKKVSTTATENKKQNKIKLISCKAQKNIGRPT